MYAGVCVCVCVCEESLSNRFLLFEIALRSDVTMQGKRKERMKERKSRSKAQNVFSTKSQNKILLPYIKENFIQP